MHDGPVKYVGRSDDLNARLKHWLDATYLLHPILPSEDSIRKGVPLYTTMVVKINSTTRFTCKGQPAPTGNVQYVISSIENMSGLLA